MAKIFLDANAFIDQIEKRRNLDIVLDLDDELYISALTIPVFFYIFKKQVPDEKINKFLEFFHIVSLSNDILTKALDGPPGDIEDNIQLHSAAEIQADIFYTSDKKLLKLKYFGGTQIKSA